MSLMVSALFLDILSNRKQVWLAIGLAAGLAYRAHHASEDASETRVRASNPGQDPSPQPPCREDGPRAMHPT